MQDSRESSAFARKGYLSVGERRAEITECCDRSFALQPYQLLSQYRAEALLNEAAATTSNTDVRYGLGLVEFLRDAGGVKVTTRDLEGDQQQLTSRYLVECDGGSSTVHKKLGIKLHGRAALSERTHGED